MSNISAKEIKITKVYSHENVEKNDSLAIEEPVEITISLLKTSPPLLNKNISITMRTPGADKELGVGFLFTEGIIYDNGQVDNIVLGENTINVFLNDSKPIDLSKIERHFYTSSSCGVCGKASIDSIKTVCRLAETQDNLIIDKDILNSLPTKLHEAQELFQSTGGLHAAALFDTKGNLIQLQEDVGRHNALDKLIGWAFIADKLPIDNSILLLSGRASFELIQKAAMAGIKCILAIGAPSSLAVELAKEFDITLIGFLKKESFNIYNGVKRIKLD